MNKRHFTVLFFALALDGCATSGSSGPTTVDQQLPIISGQAFSGIIAPRAVNFPDSWTPTDDQVVQAEPTIQGCVLAEYPRLRSTLVRYFRQYSGDRVDGRKVLHVGFFDTRHYRVGALRQPVIVVDGGGEHHFQLTFDLESEQCAF